MKLTDKNGMEGPTTATFGATDGLGRPIQITTMESYTGAASCGALHPREGWSCDLPKGHNGDHHATTLTPVQTRLEDGALDPDFEQEGIDYWLATVPPDAKPDVVAAQTAPCPGHEGTIGPAGIARYCDGSCQRRPK